MQLPAAFVDGPEGRRTVTQMKAEQRGIGRPDAFTLDGDALKISFDLIAD